MSLTDGATKKSLFIQVSSYPLTQLANHLEHVYRYHRDPSKDDHIYNVVLDEIALADGSLSPNLGVVLPYLPGGTRAAFDNVFVGSHYVPWEGPGSPYVEGFKNTDHRWENLTVQRAAWEAFDWNYDGPWHAYINHEAVLDLLDDWWLRECVQAYLVQSVLDFISIRSGAILWSPAIWSARPLVTAETAQITTLFSNVARLAPPGITWLHFQDMLGRTWGNFNEQIVATWFHQLSQVHSFDSLRVDMELFDAEQWTAEDAHTVHAREDWYQAHGIPVGASWEMRWWMQNHKEL